MSWRGRDLGHYKSYSVRYDRGGGGSHNNVGSRRIPFKNQGGNPRYPNNRNGQLGFGTNPVGTSTLSNNIIVLSNQRPNRHGTLKPRWKRSLRFIHNSFYRVEVRHGSRYDKDYLLNILASHIHPTPLIPLACKTHDNSFVFTLADHATAEKILSANRVLTLNDGWKIGVVVRPYSPIVEIDEKLTTAIKAVLTSRFDAETKSLDLTMFQDDPVFLSEQLICPLNRSNVMSFVIELVAESVPDLVALNLNKNRIVGIKHLEVMIENLPHLRILHMAHNEIREVKQLDPLKGLKLNEITLEGNAFVGQFCYKEDYIREILKRFPKLVKLDGAKIPKAVTFDLEEEDVGHLPKSQMSFMCDAEHGAVLAKSFIEQYYQIFDSEDRSLLLQAYHDTAHFSLMCHINDSSDSHSKFSNFLSENSDLLKYNHSENRLKLLKIGKSSIVEALKKLPGTDHDPGSLVVDLVLFTPEMMQLIVSGLFREKVKPNSGLPIKYFSRTFIINPVETGFCIVNDALCLHYPTSAQIRQMASKPKPLLPALATPPLVPALATPPLVPGPSAISSPAASVVNGVSPDIATKEQMVTDFSSKSGMNLIWSERCLTDNNWNREQAIFAFMQLRDSGTIPMEAFQHDCQLYDDCKMD